jgi:hypothetical protein
MYLSRPVGYHLKVKVESGVPSRKPRSMLSPPGNRKFPMIFSQWTTVDNASQSKFTALERRRATISIEDYKMDWRRSKCLCAMSDPVHPRIPTLSSWSSVLAFLSQLLQVPTRYRIHYVLELPLLLALPAFLLGLFGSSLPILDAAGDAVACVMSPVGWNGRDRFEWGAGQNAILANNH